MSGRFRARLVRVVLFSLAVLAPRLLAAQGADAEVLRGRVIGMGGRPLAEAMITITGLVTRTVITARTNTKGDYIAIAPSADGDYVLVARAIGHRPVTLRATRTGLSSVLIVNIELTAMPFQLDTITVSSARLVMQPPSVGGDQIDLLAGTLFSLDPSNLAALAALAIGVMTTTGDSTTYSVLGASTRQNSTTVDGMKFGGDNLPRDAIGAAKLVTTTYDPAAGKFAGGQIVIQTKGGTDLFQAVARAQTVDRFSTWADRSSPTPAPRIQLGSGSISGPIVRGRLRYLTAFDASHTAVENYSLLTDRAVLRSQNGLPSDTVANLSQTLGRLGVPTSPSTIPGDKGEERQTLFGRVDWTPSSTVSLTTTFNVNRRTQVGNGVGQLSLPSIASQSRRDRYTVGTSFSGYVRGILNEFKAQYSFGDNSGSPYLDLAGGSVRVGTSFDDGRTGLTTLRFGGSGSGPSQSDSRSLEVTNQFAVLTGSSRHRIKFGQSIEGDWEHERRTGNLRGTYTYQTLADLAANRPASYTRTISTRQLANRSTIVGLWLGDEWRASEAIQVQGGMRVDIARQGVLPEYNPVVDSVYGLKTNRIPSQLGLSPRVGVSWASRARRDAAKGKGTGPSFDGTSSAQSALTMRSLNVPGITVSGGVGAFRGTIDPEDIAGLIDATGLPSTTLYLSCAGDATPVPQWNVSGATIADSCRDGSGPGVFSVSRPNVTVFDPSFRSPVSWRGNLGVEGIRLGGWSMALSGTYSLGLNRESAVDLNLRRTPLFTLPGEGGRPVLVTPDAIVPSTGVIAPGAARPNGAFGRVSNTLSDLRNTASQFTLILAPRRALFGNRMPLAVQYVQAYQRAQERGFNGTTAGDPFLKEWARGSQPTHQLVVTATPRISWIALGIRLSALSGIPYTPVAVGDINGDGRSNDRAFVFDPATVGDGALATEMRTLLAAAPSGAQRCLEAQLGRIAGRNSCKTGWQLRADLSLNFSPPDELGTGSRFRVTMNLLNTTGALVRAFGLDNTPLGRSASSTTPDAKLLYVTGFDPATRHYAYRVNQLFGAPQDFGAARRRFAPFQVQLGVEYKLGGPKRVSAGERLGLVATKNAPQMSEDAIRSRMRQLTADPVQPILAQQDSLGLSPEQLAGLEVIRARFLTASDQLFAPTIALLLRRGTAIRDDALNTELGKAQPEIQKLLLREREAVGALLTAAQRAKLPKLFPPKTG
ncbi:MAG: carboxypeptidase regulatory-like domain-containing protein [Gemmatimonadetes bacterium]|nr:carboxypeptidase regulatory-like domain-containing protein [Gemmatimonadota bacterium]